MSSVFCNSKQNKEICCLRPTRANLNGISEKPILFLVAQMDVSIIILFRHRIEVLHEIAMRLRELSVLPPFQANRSCLYIVKIFSNNLLLRTLECLTTIRMQVRGRKNLDRKRKAAIALEVKVPKDIEVQCCGKWRQNWVSPS